MKKMLVVFAFAAVLGLNACRPELEHSAAGASEADSVQTLTGKDGKISVSVGNGRFEDIIGDTSRRPENVSADELVLLQYDPETRITLYAADKGAAQGDAKTYFAKLKSALQSDPSQTVRVGIATDNRMNYQTVRQDRQGVFSRYCIAIHEADIYTVCAYSHYAGQKELAAVLKDVNLAH